MGLSPSMGLGSPHDHFSRSPTWFETTFRITCGGKNAVWGVKSSKNGYFGPPALPKIPLKMHVIHCNTTSKVRNSIFHNFDVFSIIMFELFEEKKLGLRSTRGG